MEAREEPKGTAGAVDAVEVRLDGRENRFLRRVINRELAIIDLLAQSFRQKNRPDDVMPSGLCRC